MISLTEKENVLILTPDPGCGEDLAECCDLSEALDDYLCNGWGWIDPEECGALTDGSIISQEAERDENGKLIRLGIVYWDSEYMISDTLKRLKDGKTVRWVKAA